MLSIFFNSTNSCCVPILQIKESRLRDPLSLPPRLLSPFIPCLGHLLWARPRTSLKTCPDHGRRDSDTRAAGGGGGGAARRAGAAPPRGTEQADPRALGSQSLPRGKW